MGASLGTQRENKTVFATKGTFFCDKLDTSQSAYVQLFNHFTMRYARVSLLAKKVIKVPLIFSKHIKIALLRKNCTHIRKLNLKKQQT